MDGQERVSEYMVVENRVCRQMFDGIRQVSRIHLMGHKGTGCDVCTLDVLDGEVLVLWGSRVVDRVPIGPNGAVALSFPGLEAFKMGGDQIHVVLEEIED